MHTVLSSSTSTHSVFLFTTPSNEDGFINHRTTERAKAHRSICSPMIKVGAPLSLHYHSSLSLHLWLWTLGKLCISITQFFLTNGIIINVWSRPFPKPLNICSSFIPGLINSRCANSWWVTWMRELTIYWNTIKRLDCYVSLLYMFSSWYSGKLHICWSYLHNFSA